MKLEFWVIAFGYYWLENNFFGWNLLPLSAEEVIADGIWVLIMTIGFAVGRGQP